MKRRPTKTRRAAALVATMTSVVALGVSVWPGSSAADVITSPNWSGYAVQAAHPFTAVAGSWAQPATTCAGAPAGSEDALWVGLDGYDDQTVEQIGTKTTCVDGTAVYVAWWQMYPAPYHPLSASTYPVHPGDELSADVQRSGASYTLSLHSSAGWSYATTTASDAVNSSAEWIASTPPLCPTCGFSPLADFGRVTFTAAEASVGPSLRRVATFTGGGGPHDITLQGPGGVDEASPGPLAPSGGRFDVTWDQP